MSRTVGADVLSNTEGHIRGTNGPGPREPTGVEDRSTCTRQSRELGRSSGLLQGRGEDGATSPLAGQPTVQRKSDALI
jgi:hypothetical protein